MNPYLSRVLEIFDGVAISTSRQIFLPVGYRLSTKPWELQDLVTVMGRRDPFDDRYMMTQQFAAIAEFPAP